MERNTASIPFNKESGDAQDDILTMMDNMMKKHKEEDEAFLNNKYHARRSQNSNYLFNDDSKFLSLTFINNNLALQQYIKDQRARQKNIEKGKLSVNYNAEFSNKYVPGKRTINYPTTSCLARNQMTAAYFQFINYKTHEEAFKSSIREENEEFQSYVQQMWRNTNYQRAVDINPSVESIIDIYWQSKISEAKALHPSVYVNVNTIPLTLNEEESNLVYLSHIADLRSEGSYHEMRESMNIEQEYRLTTDSKEFSSWLQYEQKTESSIDANNSLDQDQTAESLATRNNCQVVMTTSSVKTLLNNHSENHFATSWMLPVHIRLVLDPTTGHEKKVIFIDKKLTHKSLTNTHKLNWFTKLAAKKFCFDYSSQIEEVKTQTSRNKQRKRARNSRDDTKPNENLDEMLAKIAKDALSYARNKIDTNDVSKRDEKSELNVNTFPPYAEIKTKAQRDETLTKHSDTVGINSGTPEKQKKAMEHDETLDVLKTATHSPSRITRSQMKNIPVKRKSCDMRDGTNISKLDKDELSLEEANESESHLGKKSLEKITGDECNSYPELTDKGGDKLSNSEFITSKSWLRSSSFKKENASCLSAGSERVNSGSAEGMDSDEDEGLMIDLPDDPSHSLSSDESDFQVPNPSSLKSPQPITIEESPHTKQDRRVDSREKISKFERNTARIDYSCGEELDFKAQKLHPTAEPNGQSPGSKSYNRPPPKPLEPMDYSLLTSHGRNKKYSLWKLFKEYTPGSELLKNVRHPLNILLRSKQDAKNKSHSDQERYLCIRPKVEFQPEYGAEVSSLHELLDEWASLCLRPKTDLLRVRVAYDNLEVIMSEIRHCSDLSHLIQSQHKINPRHTVGNLYSVLWYLMELPPGKYLLTHEPKNNAFVNVFRADPKGSYLPMAGWHCSEGIARAPWRPIDPSVLTPIHQFSKTLPCLFPPSSGVAAIKRNVKKHRNEIYQKHIADLKKQNKADHKRRQQQRKRKDKKKKKNETGVTEGLKE